MKSTPIGISIQPQPMPILYPQTDTNSIKHEPSISPAIESNTILEINYDENTRSAESVEQGELYAEYLTNPYNDAKDTTREATLYEAQQEPQNPLLSVIDKQKSFSANATPLHKNKAQFGSTDNIKQESSIFNFASYFGSVNEKAGSEVFDSLMSQEG